MCIRDTLIVERRPFWELLCYVSSNGLGHLMSCSHIRSSSIGMKCRTVCTTVIDADEKRSQRGVAQQDVTCDRHPTVQVDISQSITV